MPANTRTLVNVASGGSLKTKTPEEALELLELVASQEFDNAPTPVAPRSSRIMKLEGYDEAHATEDCEYIRNTEKQPAEANALWYDQKNSNNQGRNRYGNQGWKNNNQHPGLSYKSNYQLNPPMPLQQQPQGTTSEWEKAFAQLSKTTSDFIQNADAFRDETRASFRNQEASIRNLETQIVVNLREHCNAITTRSGTVIQPVEKPPVEKKKEAEPEVEKDKEEDAVEAEKCIPKKKLFKWEKKKALDRQPKAADLSPFAKVPYPQRLKQEVQKQQYTKFLDIFKKLQVNIPFAEALENMTNYARFMKDLLSRKRKLQECETVILTEECNAIIQKKLPTKVKDPGSFSIPCIIGKMEVDNKLGITEVKPIKTIVQLAERSSKQAYDIIEDILVKVDKFIIPVDFVILDIEEDATIPMIFGRPFLSTSGALIDVLKGELILRVDGEQATFKFIDKEVPSSVAQPKDQVYFIVEKKGEEEHNEESSRESKPKVKMEKPSSEGKHVKVKFKVPETTLPHPYAEEHYGRTQFMNDGAWLSPRSYFEPP
ncbi:uncharacterized protein LOC133287456 [Gastrolobium bilobum]|uniref:uncharacterized protein LOC133287456 n=1 Tax=Gastrolobium bilobum TaxID=150636 RepID=UPI002AAF906A|nr:uncharacterized protein LOC133287456 [Gastrolobium bilobum]